jgi:hypothetical protein
MKQANIITYKQSPDASNLPQKTIFVRVKHLTIFIILIMLFGKYDTILSQKQYTIEKLPFCSYQYDEFSPAYYKDGLVFCANIKNSFFFVFVDTSEYPELLFDLYYSKCSKDGKKWQTPVPIKELNSYAQEGPTCFYDNFTKVAFTRSTYIKTSLGNYLKGNNHLGIFFAELSGKKWTNIVPFDFNSDSYNVMHPAITEDGNTLYFASDKPGGIGGYDIYESKKVHDRWTAPVNLGPNVNTPKDEAFPFIHPSGRLFFASRGWNSRGGFDIFFTQIFKGNWITPQNLKEPFSSTADDFGYIADDYLQSGYFSSSRNNNDDIFSFKSTISEFENCTQQKENTYCYYFFENGTSENDITGTMKYEWDFGDGTKMRAIAAEHCFAKTGKYIIHLNVIDSLTNEVLLNQAEYELEVTDHIQPYITAPDIGTIGQTINFDARKTNLKNFRIAKYSWDFGDETKAIGDNISHVYYQEGIYDVKLQVESEPTKNGVQKMCVYKTIIIEK